MDYLENDQAVQIANEAANVFFAELRRNEPLNWCETKDIIELIVLQSVRNQTISKTNLIKGFRDTHHSGKPCELLAHFAALSRHLERVFLALLPTRDSHIQLAHPVLQR